MNSANPELEVQKVTDVSGFSELRIEWESLENSDPCCTPFNTWLWQYTWWTHYASKPDTELGRNIELCIIVLRANGSLVAIAPLYVSTQSELRMLPMRVLRFVGSGGDTSPDYLGMLCKPAFQKSAVEHVLKQLSQWAEWQKLHFSDLLIGNTLDDALKSWGQQHHGLVVPGRRNRIRYNNLPESWDAYRETLSRKRRKQLNHRNNRLARAGQTRIAICSTRQEIKTATHSLVELHRSRWLSKHDVGAFQSKRYVNFHTEIIDQFYIRGQIWLVMLELNNRTIGVLYAFYWRDTVWLFQSGFAPEHEDLSPGHIMFTHVIEQAIRQGARRINLLKGDYPYKRFYGPLAHETHEFIFVRPGVHQLLSGAKLVARNVLQRG